MSETDFRLTFPNGADMISLNRGRAAMAAAPEGAGAGASGAAETGATPDFQAPTPQPLPVGLPAPPTTEVEVRERLASLNSTSTNAWSRLPGARGRGIALGPSISPAPAPVLDLPAPLGYLGKGGSPARGTMLRELLTHLFTPATGLARRLGYLYEVIAIQGRHGRNRAAWAGHLENTRALILEAAEACPRRDLALVLGSGPLLDIPLAELSARFRRVVLADMVHPRPARRLARRLGNVDCLDCDLSGVASQVADIIRSRTKSPLPEPRPPRLPDLAPDLTVSANLLSQLPTMPLAALRRLELYQEEELRAFARRLISGHLDWLAGRPGLVCLITDLARLTVSDQGTQEEDALYGLTVPAGGRTWLWSIAPRPEAFPDKDRINRVAGVVFSGTGA